jgi:hypothetical protein
LASASEVQETKIAELTQVLEAKDKALAIASEGAEASLTNATKAAEIAVEEEKEVTRQRMAALELEAEHAAKDWAAQLAALEQDWTQRCDGAIAERDGALAEVDEVTAHAEHSFQAQQVVPSLSWLE